MILLHGSHDTLYSSHDTLYGSHDTLRVHMIHYVAHMIQNLEQFMGEVDGLLETMALLEQHITKEYTAEDVEGAEKVLQQHCSMEEELKMCPQEVLKAGRDLISSIEQKPDCSGTSSITPDKINAAATIR